MPRVPAQQRLALSQRIRAHPALSVACVVAVIIQVVVLYWPRPPSGAGGLGLDKIVHVLIFAVPVALVILLTSRRRLTAAIFAAHALFSEVVQAAVLPQRSGDLPDLLADLLGVTLGVGLAQVLGRRDR